MPAKSRGRKHAAEGSAASSPNNCPHGKLAKAEAASSEDEAVPAGDAFQAAQQQLGPAGGAPHPEAGEDHTLAIRVSMESLLCDADGGRQQAVLMCVA